MTNRPHAAMRRPLTRQQFLRLSGAGIVGAALLGSAACERGGGGGGSDAEFTIRMSHVVTPETPKGMASTKFKEVLEQNTDGRMTVEIYPNSELYGDEEEVQALQSGGVDMIAPASSKLTDIAPQLFVLDLPFLVDSLEQVPEVIAPDTTVGKAVYANQDLADNNMKIMGLWDNGLYQITCNSAIQTPADLNGKRIRITPSDVIKSYWEAWGAGTTPMAFAEVFTALQQGVIDGQFNPYSNIESQRFYEVQDFMTVSNHGYLTYIFAINNEFFEGLPSDLQEAVQDAADEASTYNREIAGEVNAEARKVIEDAGTTEIIELTDAERQAFKDVVVPSVWDQYADVIGKDIIDELRNR